MTDIGPIKPPATPSANIDRHEAIRKAARQFEGLFVRELMKSMRKTVPTGSDSSFSRDTFTEMFDEAVTKEAAQGGALGLSDMIAREFGAQVDADLKVGVLPSMSRRAMTTRALRGRPGR